MLGQPAACILLLTTGATAFDYLASLTVQDAATVAKPAAKDTSYLESLPQAVVLSAGRGRGALTNGSSHSAATHDCNGKGFISDARRAEARLKKEAEREKMQRGIQR